MKDRDRFTTESAPTEVVSPNAPTHSEIDYSSTQAQQYEQFTATRQLQRQVQWLKVGLVASVMIFGSALAGVLLGTNQQQSALRSTQEELSAQVETLSDKVSTEPAPVEEPADSGPVAALPNIEQLTQLREQLAQLTQQTQEISEQAEKAAEQLPTISSEQVDDLRAQIDSLKQDIQNNLSSEAIAAKADQLIEWLQRQSL